MKPNTIIRRACARAAVAFALRLALAVVAAGTIWAGDSPPTITSIANQTIAEDAATASLAFTVSDPDVSAANLVVVGSSSNQNLVDYIYVQGNGAQRTVLLFPKANQSGVATITLTVYDPVLPAVTASTSFVLTVNPVNDAPIMTWVADSTRALEDTQRIITRDYLIGISDARDVDSPNFNFRVEAVSSGTLGFRPIGSTSAPTAVTAQSTILDSTRELVWTPPLNFSGSTNMFTVKAHDGTLLSATALAVPVYVDQLNDAPTMAAITAKTTSEDVPTASIAVTISDVETPLANLFVDGDSSNPALVEPLNMVFGGTAGARTLVITPKSNQSGTATITVRVTDNGSPAYTASRSFLLTVNAVNDAPTMTAVSPLPGTTEDTAYVISYAALQAAADEADVDSGTINFRIEAVSNGTLGFRAAGTTGATTAVTAASTILDATRELVWTPAANANGTVNAFTVKAHDGALASATAIAVPVVVAAVNDTPTMAAITAKTTNEDVPTASIAVTITDVETPLASLVVSGSSSNTALVDTANMVFGGTAGARTLVITPKANQSGTATITVTVADGGTPALTASQSFVLTVNAVADAPTLTTVAALPGATEDTAYVISYAALQAAADEADVDSATINFRIEAVSNGSLRYRAAGTTGATTAVATTAPLTILDATRELVWTPAANANGTINAFTIRAHDGALASSTAIAVPVVVAAVNDTPTMAAITAKTTNEDTATASIAVTITDVETPLASLVVSGSSSNTALVDTANMVFGGTAGARTLVITPKANQSGTATITVTVADGGTPALTASQSFVLTVNAVADAPTLTTVAALPGATEDTAYVISYAALQAAADEADVDSATINFRIEAVSNGSLRYRAAGTTGATTAVATTAPLTILDATRELVWTPAANANGTINAFTIRAHDGAIASSTAIAVPVVVAAVNDTPTMAAITAKTTNEDTATASIAVTITDVETPLASLVVSGSSSNTALVDTANMVFGGTAGARTLVITPKPNQNGTATITVTVADGGAPALTASQSFVLTVNAVADAPTLTAVAALTGGKQNTPFVVSYAALATAANEFDPDAGAVVNFRIEAVSSGSLGVRAAGSTAAPTAVVAASTILDATKELVWTPPAGINGTLNAFTIKAHDGALVSATAVPVQVVVAPPNLPPTLTTVTPMTGAAEDTPFIVSYAALQAAANEADADSSVVNFRLVAVSSGTLGVRAKDSVVTPDPVVPGSTVLSATTEWVWTPAVHANGNLPAFSIVAWDGLEPSTTPVVVTVQTAAVSDPPALTAIAVLSGGVEDTAYVIRQSAVASAADETDPDGGMINFRITAVSSGTLGVRALGSTGATTPIVAGTTVLDATNELVWTPPANQSGTLTACTLVAWDGALASATSVPLQVALTAVNDTPTITSISNKSTAEDTTSAAISFTVADVETPAANLLVWAWSLNQALLDESGITYAGTTGSRSIQLTPKPNMTGSTTVTVSVSDRDNPESIATRSFTFTVTAVNDPPVLTTSTPVAGGTEDQPMVVSFANLQAACPATDVDSSTITYRIASVVSGSLGIRPAGTTGTPAPVSPGVTMIDAGSELVWTPPANAAGPTVAANIHAFDGSAVSATTVPLTVFLAPVGDVPTIATIPPQTTQEDVPTAGIPIVIADGETPADQLAVRVTSSDHLLVDPLGIRLTGTGANRTLVLAPMPDASGAVTITVSVSDRSEPPISSQVSFPLTISPVNDPPDVVARAVTLAPMQVEFSGLGTADRDSTGLTYTWEVYGEGVVASTQTFTKTYTDPGTYELYLTVSDGQTARTGSVAVVVSNDPVLHITTPTTIDAAYPATDGRYLIVDGTTLTVTAPRRFKGGRVINSGVITAPASTTTTECVLDLTFDRDLFVASGARIDVRGKGYLPGYTVGNVQWSTNGRSGGSHGGYGDPYGTGPYNEVYGDFINPLKPGSGGGAGVYSVNGSGGGAVLLRAGSLVVDGSITADGQSMSGSTGSGGAGGSVNITLLDGLHGSGTISALGGNSVGTAGHGGGGRIAVRAGVRGGFPVARLQAYGGGPTAQAMAAAPGSVYVAVGADAPILRFDNNGRTPINPVSVTPLWFGLRGQAGDDPAIFSVQLQVLGKAKPRVEGATLLDLRGSRTVIQDAELTAANVSAGLLTLSTGAVLDGAALSVRGLWATGNSTIWAPGQVNATVASLNLTATERVIIDAGSAVLGNSRGYPGGFTAGYVQWSTNGRSGGSHGGFGDPYGTGPYADCYDSFADPQMPGAGSGRGFYSAMAAGGGVILITAADVWNRGTIAADGGSVTGSAGAGGAGGTVNIRSSGPVLLDGPVSTVGGNSNSTAGHGGGGRIAVRAGSGSSLAWSQLRANGGGPTAQALAGGAGSVYLEEAGQHPTLIFDNAGKGTNTGDGWATGVWFGNRADSADDPVSFPVRLRVANKARILVEGQSTIIDLAPELTVDGGEIVAQRLQANALRVRSGGIVEAANITAGSMVVEGGGLVRNRMPPGSSGQVLQIAIAGSLSIATGASISADGRGYRAGRTAGDVIWSTAGRSGGSHGGHGDPYGTGPYCDVYGDMFDPRLPGAGSGSGYYSYACSGGGAVIITCAALVVDGQISARGQSASGNTSAGGAGGSVNISASGMMSGSGTVSVTGGASQGSTGHGGGGRIAIRAGAGTSFDWSKVTAHGGGPSAQALAGGPGTIYIRLAGQTHGRLIISGAAGQTPNPSYPTLIWFGDRNAASGTQPICPEDFTIEGNLPWVVVGDPTVFDADRDTLPSWQELAIGGNPRAADSNGDGIRDDVAVQAGLAPGATDPDGDGLDIASELALGTNPYVADSDGDGVPDGTDRFPTNPAASAWPVPPTTDTKPPAITVTAPANLFRIQ